MYYFGFMSFCKRIIISLSIFIAVLAGQGWSVAPATHFDFSYESGLHMQERVRNVAATARRSNNILPGAIIIPLAKPGSQFVAVYVLDEDSPVIYFPNDGRQPTTEEAVVWSCANIDNEEDSPITEWYMRMFGWYRRGEVVIEAGFAQNNKAQPILNMDKSMCGSCLNCCVNTYATEFWKTFRQVAANPVGRILLYRLLIEIRRIDDGGQGCPEAGRKIRLRNRLRSLSVIKNNLNEWCFYPAGEIEFTNKTNLQVPTTGPHHTVPTSFQKRDLCIGLFHEMLHWYHYLRDTLRANTENLIAYDSLLIAPNSLVEYYFYNENLDAPHLRTWSHERSLRVEEMRTILGASPDVIGHNGDVIHGFLNGDDLSENLFRCALNYQNIINDEPRVYMRYGYSSITDNNAIPAIWLAYKCTIENMMNINLEAAFYWDIRSR